MVQTIGNNQPGGESLGLLIISNIVILSLEVKLANAPTKIGSAIQKIKVFHFIFKKSPLR